ncbi:unnamed protein product [Ostreobium quekettii]|uniref:Endonuclease V n=1 Tax=Ostreobium quekettii TaxID=121088 RepID=A0A8S1J8D0_9CHLO|nr:unnamed protein product [Ostreobium quekettii]|eukprot:evm.model.scf_521.8 EVM.evm.TU.scf_521.8   scf_521:76893-79250(-)
MAGYLGFRECPAFQRLLQRVSATEHNPQAVFVDGNGILHPRRCGSASHLGVVSGYPTIGIAKNLLHVDGLDERAVRTAVKNRIDTHGSSTSPSEMNVPLIGRSGQVLGAAMYGHGASVSQPVSQDISGIRSLLGPALQQISHT